MPDERVAAASAGAARGDDDRPVGAPAPLDAVTIPLALYLHFPWCVRKCPYCDFNSHSYRGALEEFEYVEALLRDLDYELQSAETRTVRSIFCGGGTPSLFSGAALTRLFAGLAQRLHFADDIEITLEANPGTADAANFRAYREAGVNRLSLGVQSLDDGKLKRLGRIHGRAEALSAVALARAAGFDNLNLDLMYALPEQTLAEAEADLAAAIALAPEHLSYYQLTLEPHTEFAAQPPPLPDDELAWSMQLAGQAQLADAGYAQYEVSAYARPDRQCQHNRNYWQFGDYLGIGAGAHGKRSTADGILRRARHRNPRHYLQHAGSAAAIQEERRILPDELPFEYMMNALRLDEGLRYGDFEQRTGLSRQTLAPALRRAAARGLIDGFGDDDCPAEAGLRTTAFGRAHLNALLREFL